MCLCLCLFAGCTAALPGASGLSSCSSETDDRSLQDDDTSLQQDGQSAHELGYYAHDSLSADDREIYDAVYDALAHYSKRDLPTDDREYIERIIDCVFADHPELSDISAPVICEADLFTPTAVAGVALMDTSKAEELQARLAAVADEYLSAIPEGADDYLKAKTAYEQIVLNTAYDRAQADNPSEIVINAEGKDTFTLSEGSSVPAEHGQTAANALLDKQAVCAGYARAFQYLLQRLGIECTYVAGNANGGSHAWCLALLDGRYYLIDPTWGDPEYISLYGGEPPEDTVDYRFFGVTTDDMAPTHTPDDTFSLPRCSSYDDNYFVREGLYFEEADTDLLAGLVADALAQSGSVAIRCATPEVFTELLYDHVQPGNIGWYTAVDGYQYTYGDEGIYTIEIWPL